MRSKLPELRREPVEISKEEIRDRDWSNKLKGKAYADNRRGATPKSIRIGDAVLQRAEKSNKLSSNFNPSPFKVVNKTGAEVTVRNDAGAEFKRNTAFVKKYNQQDGNCAQDGEMSAATVPSETEMSVNSQLPPASSPEKGGEVADSADHPETSTATSQETVLRRSSRVSRRPVRFQDYV